MPWSDKWLWVYLCTWMVRTALWHGHLRVCQQPLSEWCYLYWTGCWIPLRMHRLLRRTKLWRGYHTWSYCFVWTFALFFDVNDAKFCFLHMCLVLLLRLRSNLLHGMQFSLWAWRELFIDLLLAPCIALKF